MTERIDFAQAIRQRRKGLKMSQISVAKRAGIGVSTVRTIENGQRENPTYITMESILGALGMRMEFVEADAERREE